MLQPQSKHGDVILFSKIPNIFSHGRTKVRKPFQLSKRLNVSCCDYIPHSEYSLSVITLNYDFVQFETSFKNAVTSECNVSQQIEIVCKTK